MATKSVKSKFDFSKIDIGQIDPDRLDMGTGLQDCSLIAQTFERGAHTIPTEAAVFSTLTRSLQNRKTIARVAADSMATYLHSPVDAATQTAQQVTDLTGTTNTGASSQTDQMMQSLNFGNTQQSTFGDSFGKKLLEANKDCIPCNLRMLAFLELHPSLDLLKGYEDFIQNSLMWLSNLTNLLKDFSIFGDFCNLLNSLSFMCIPDLQRIIAALMAMFLTGASSLDGLIGMLQTLIAPLFAPILTAITSLLDQFTQLVVGPLRCVLDALNTILKMQQQTTAFVPPDTTTTTIQLGGGLKQLTDQLNQAVTTITTKHDFYVSQMKAMMGELGGGDSAYLTLKFQALTLVRLIAFVIAIIVALTQGHVACDTTGKPVDRSELDSFFQNYLSPTVPFNIWIDPTGQIHVDEKLPNFDKATTAISTGQPLPQFGNMVQFEGEELLNTSTSDSISNIANTTNFVGAASQLATALRTPAQIIVPCKLEIATDDVDKVNRWIAQLNQT